MNWEETLEPALDWLSVNWQSVIAFGGYVVVPVLLMGIKLIFASGKSKREPTDQERLFGKVMDAMKDSVGWVERGDRHIEKSPYRINWANKNGSIGVYANGVNVQDSLTPKQRREIGKQLEWLIVQKKQREQSAKIRDVLSQLDKPKEMPSQSLVSVLPEGEVVDGCFVVRNSLNSVPGTTETGRPK